ncbi:MAG TPA: calcium/sodium antiporter [Candidatus Butyricicoccus avistercoris]|uniref:Calcium/sodium antiporter n=1 Tax=Candidatus Butyricicoccus avistercoris TaxID=2838518 RepID=A0A9D1PHR1_9FIRM|nr:calcium/sodium antiporter [Candidatus Butyricicoccus avistercoris]
MILYSLCFFIIGLILTMRGGDVFVDSAAKIAEASGIPRFVIGATLVSICTTAPELTVSILASLRGASELAVGNAVGSVACNTGLILGISALLAPSVFSVREAKTKGAVLICLGVLTGCFCVDGVINSGEALGLFTLLFAFLAMNLQNASNSENVSRNIKINKVETFLMFLVGAISVVLGAKLMVDHGTRLASMLGIPESIIGLTLVALGTSLPELMTTLSAIRKGHGMLSVGNIIGANIINLSLVVPSSALASGGILVVEPEVFVRDLPFAVILIGISLIPPMFHGKFFRIQGLSLIVCYFIYVSILMRTI